MKRIVTLTALTLALVPNAAQALSSSQLQALKASFATASSDNRLIIPASGTVAAGTYKAAQPNALADNLNKACNAYNALGGFAKNLDSTAFKQNFGATPAQICPNVNPATIATNNDVPSIALQNATTAIRTAATPADVNAQITRVVDYLDRIGATDVANTLRVLQTRAGMPVAPAAPGGIIVGGIQGQIDFLNDSITINNAAIDKLFTDNPTLATGLSGTIANAMIMGQVVALNNAAATASQRAKDLYNLGAAAGVIGNITIAIIRDPATLRVPKISTTFIVGLTKGTNTYLSTTTGARYNGLYKFSVPFNPVAPAPAPAPVPVPVPAPAPAIVVDAETLLNDLIDDHNTIVNDCVGTPATAASPLKTEQGFETLVQTLNQNAFNLMYQALLLKKNMGIDADAIKVVTVNGPGTAAANIASITAAGPIKNSLDFISKQKADNATQFAPGWFTRGHSTPDVYIIDVAPISFEPTVAGALDSTALLRTLLEDTKKLVRGLPEFAGAFQASTGTRPVVPSVALKTSKNTNLTIQAINRMMKAILEDPIAGTLGYVITTDNGATQAAGVSGEDFITAEIDSVRRAFDAAINSWNPLSSWPTVYVKSVTP